MLRPALRIRLGATGRPRYPRPIASPRTRTALLYGATLSNFTSFGLFLAAIPLFVSDELGGSNTAVGISVGSFAISAVLLRPLVGRGVDARGRRPFLIGGLLLQAVAAVGFELVHAVPAVVVLRLVQGVAGACFYTTAASAATDLSPPEKRAGALARLSLFIYGGFALGPLIGEWSIRTHGFAWTWAIALGIIGAGLVLAALLPETRPPDPALLAARAAARRAAGQRRRFLQPEAVTPGLILMTAGVGYASITTFSPLYAREIGMASSSTLYATFAITILAVRLVAGGVADRFGFLNVALPGMIAAASGLAVMALFPRPATAILGVAIFGVGFALLFPALAAYTVSRVHEDERGEALGSFTAFMDIGTATGGYLVGFVADRAGFAWAYGTPALLACGGLALVVRLMARPAGAPAGVGVGTGTVAGTEPA
ncbi:MAG: MFS transporter [Acidimicrobiales bacterium]|nr:MFS transporter [Acidimicrobiales bacterium]